ncbi:hormogonium polysaccharide biosynthesis protein HpsL [Leptolyngbya sp. BC1307]|uniref:hormogonium polysaccharide biosynthesis protein HpsL n=1 Tax=Leptolyngbya sp. BC1307 TaxID=2029589 RepID=UPI0019815D8F|nr:hormogonium polysaccharide biosynthesis protein HpsL [Leptolyngbya sp. BC1307]
MVSRSSGKRSIKQSLRQSKKRSKGKEQRVGNRAQAAAKGRQQPGAAASSVAIAATGNEKSLSPRQKLILEREAAARRQQTVTYAALVTFGSTFIGLLTGLLVDPILGVAVGSALTCLLLSFKFQRLALYAFIIYVPFAGTVTYALGGNPILQIAKDVFYIPALIGLYQFCRKNRLPIILPKAIKPPLVFLLIVVSMTIVVTNLPDQIGQVDGRFPMLMALWGAKIFFGYVPLVACIYYLIRNKEDLVFILRLQIILVLVACGLGLIQYLMLKTGACPGTTGTGGELFRASLDARCFVGGSLLYSPDQGQIRLPGTFVAPWQWGWFLISAAFFSFGTTFSDKSAFWRLVGLISLVAVMVMAVVSGQRIALVVVPISIVTLTVMTGQVANLKRFIPIGVILGLSLSYLVTNNPAMIATRTASLQSRWNASPPQAFIAGQFDDVWQKQKGIFGHGVGRATNSARTFGDTALIETYHPKLIYEIGPIGLFAVLAVYTALTIATFKIYRSTRDKNLRSYAASMWVFILFISYFPYYYPLDVDPVGVYYWLAAGIILKIPELERQEQEKLALESPETVNELPKSGRRKRLKKQPTFV